MMLSSDTLELFINSEVPRESLLGIARSLEQAETWAEVYSLFWEFGVHAEDIREFFEERTGEQMHGYPNEREWLKLKSEILRRDAYSCAYCFTEEGPWCADHVIPLSKGGSNSYENLTACCLPCNSSKSNRLLGEWNGRYTR